MPACCSADRNPTSSAPPSPESAYTGAAMPIAVEAASTAGRSFIATLLSWHGVRRPLCAGPKTVRANCVDCSTAICALTPLLNRRNDSGFVAFGQMHGVDTGFFRELFEQCV